MRSVLTRPRTPAGEHDAPRRWLLPAGLGAFALALGLYVIYMVIHPKSFTMDPVDLAVYRSGGLIVRHVRPLYDPRLAAPLYDWVGYGKLHLPFTYTPFAAITFALISFVPWWLSQQLSVAVDILALLTSLWLILGGLGYRKDRTRLGVTLLGAAAAFWTEPVLRTMYLGQVNLVLMALISWDLCQPDTGKSRWWKGFGTGIAAGVKLVPLIFIPYLLLARKFRQAAMACAGFAFTVLLGFVILPTDSRKWWFDGLFFQGGRTGFTGWAGNQSLDGLITRLTGSINGAKPAWIAAAVVVGAIGVTAAALLDRKGYPVPGLLTAALTGLLVSPISWDHHWVWIAPGALVAAHYAVRAVRRGDRKAACGLGVLAVAMQSGSVPGRPGCSRPSSTSATIPSACSGSRRTPTRSTTSGTGTGPGSPSTTGTRWPSSRATRTSWPAWACSGCWPRCRCCSRASTKEQHDEPGRAQGSLRGRLRLPAA